MKNKVLEYMEELGTNVQGLRENGETDLRTVIHLIENTQNKISSIKEKETNQFKELLKVNVKDHIEKKNGMSYLSWVFAWSEVKQIDPKASFKIHDFPLMGYPEILVPYLQTPTGYYVRVSVTINDQTETETYPVMDERMNPLGTKMMAWSKTKKGSKEEVIQPDPTSNEINKAHKRALTKCIALHGLGLSIYAGEDIPVNDDPDQSEPPKSATKKNSNTNTPAKEKTPPAPAQTEPAGEEKPVSAEQVFLIEQLAFEIGQLRKVDPAKILESATGDKSVILTNYNETIANKIMDKLLSWKTQAEEKAKSGA